MIVASPVNPLAFATPIPRVTLTDLQSSTSDATVYTFSACQVNLGGTLSFADTFGTNPYVISSSRNFVAVAVHSEDAAATFSISGVTLGGVSGTEIYDRGGAGAGVLVNTAFYVWATEALQGIANTDIAVTHSEAVTGCAIAVLSISNVATLHWSGTGADTTGGGTLTINGPSSSSVPGVKGLQFVFSTINAAGEAFSLSTRTPTSPPGSWWPVNILYEGSNAEFGYAGAYTYQLETGAGDLQFSSYDASWSGTANADAIAPVIIRI